MFGVCGGGRGGAGQARSNTMGLIVREGLCQPKGWAPTCGRGPADPSCRRKSGKGVREKGDPSAPPRGGVAGRRTWSVVTLSTVTPGSQPANLEILSRKCSRNAVETPNHSSSSSSAPRLSSQFQLYRNGERRQSGQGTEEAGDGGWGGEGTCVPGREVTDQEQSGWCRGESGQCHWKRTW